MSTRWSGRAREPLDFYKTPGWVVSAAIPHLPREPRVVLEPAEGDGGMVAVLREEFPFAEIIGTDIAHGRGLDFMQVVPTEDMSIDLVITNPPFNLLDHFIEQALAITKPTRGVVALLARATADSAHKRRRWFQHPAFAKKVTLTERIVWFERTDGKVAAPSEDHAWYCWSWEHVGLPTIVYAPAIEDYRTRHPGRAKKVPQVEASASPPPLDRGQHHEVRP